jgi:hypothetical protein
MKRKRKNKRPLKDYMYLFDKDEPTLYNTGIPPWNKPSDTTYVIQKLKIEAQEQGQKQQ